MSKVRLNFHIHTLGGGGAEKALINLVNNLDFNKYSVKVTTIINTGTYQNLLANEIEVQSVFKIPNFILKRNTNEFGTLKKSDGSRLAFLEKFYLFFWKYLSFILIFKANSVNRDTDIAISYLEGPTQIFVSKVRRNVKKISWVHVDLSVEKKSEKFFRSKRKIRNSFSKFNYIAAVSMEVKDSIINYIGVDDINTRVIYNVYDVNEIISKSLLESDFSYINNKINIISVGRLSNQKGYDRLIDAALNLSKFKESFSISILGTGEDYDLLSNKIITNNAQDYIKLLGYIDNPYSYIRNNDVFFSSSRTEGYSTVVVESLILNTPVISTECSGIFEILDNGKYGNIIDNTSSAIEEHLKLLITKPDYLDKLRKKVTGSQGVFSIEKSISDIENFIDEVYKNEI